MPAEESTIRFDLAVKVTFGLMLTVSVVTHGMALSASATIGLLVVAVGVFGIPHGAFDYAVAKKSGVITSRRSAIFFLFAYLGVAAGSFALWLLYPRGGLVVFLVISVWHFSHDWVGRGWLYRSAMALLVVFGPLVVWPDRVLYYFNVLLFGDSITASPQSLLLFGLLVGVLWGTACGLKLVRRQWHDVLECVLLFLGVFLFEPLIFFVIYFCGLHSVRSMTHLRKQLGGTLAAFIARGLLPTLATYGLGFAVYAMLPSINSSEGLVKVIFIGLFALTVPHLLLDTWIDTLRHVTVKGSVEKCSDDTVASISV